MEAIEIKEGNEIIKSFTEELNISGPWETEPLKFHDSYDWIMQLVECISKMDFKTDLITYHDIRKQGSPMVYAFRIDKYAKIISFYESGNMKHSIFKSIVKFINWYKLNKDKHVN